MQMIFCLEGSREVAVEKFDRSREGGELMALEPGKRQDGIHLCQNPRHGELPEGLASRRMEGEGILIKKDHRTAGVTGYLSDTGDLQEALKG
jgi:hypothetical protein